MLVRKVKFNSAEFPDSNATEYRTVGQLAHVLAKTKIGHWCGYVIWPRRPLIEQGHRGIARYVPVHGGITYAGEREDGCFVYGFDCAHSGDEGRPETRDVDWLRDECRWLAASLRIARWYEPFYLLAPGNRLKALVLDLYHRHVRKVTGKSFCLTDNFGAMLAVLFGHL